jgi:hypothetical protein
MISHNLYLFFRSLIYFIFKQFFIFIKIIGNVYPDGENYFYY